MMSFGSFIVLCCLVFVSLFLELGMSIPSMLMSELGNLTDHRLGPMFNQHSNDNTLHGSECGIWFAPSTIPGAGFGLFAGRDFEEDEPFLSTGDLVIPVIDIVHYLDDRRFLWDDYIWLGSFMTNEASKVEGASPGFGAASNCYPGLTNADELTPKKVDMTGLHRHTDPGVGAFTAYYDRQTIAEVPVAAAEEIFVDYGRDYFLSRQKELGPIPFESDFRRGENLLNKFTQLRDQMGGNASSSEVPTLPDKFSSGQENEEPVSKAIYEDFWERFVLSSPFRESSRTLNVFPRTWSDTEEMIETGVKEKRKEGRRRSLKWLEEHGTCADNMEMRRSTIRQAGRGAFAARYLPEGSIVAPVPLIHLPDREILDIYDFKKDDTTGKILADKTRPPIGKQLLLNYCMGHSESTLLLCPYGVHTGFVNHNQTQANVRLQWAEPSKSNHQQEWLNLTVDELNEMTSTGLAMELVATQDIHPGDEIFLDYGQEWDDAWNEHVWSWKPFPGSEHHRGAHEINQDGTILRTVFEEMENPLYPKDVELKCLDAYKRDTWKEFYPDRLDRLFWEVSQSLTQCDVLRWDVDDKGRVLYTAVLRDFKSTRLTRVPREAFRFVDHPYTSDMHLPNAFRHEIMIPDEIFPENWKNLV